MDFQDEFAGDFFWWPERSQVELARMDEPTEIRWQGLDDFTPDQGLLIGLSFLPAANQAGQESFIEKWLHTSQRQISGWLVALGEHSSLPPPLKRTVRRLCQ